MKPPKPSSAYLFEMLESAAALAPERGLKISVGNSRDVCASGASLT